MNAVLPCLGLVLAERHRIPNVAEAVVESVNDESIQLQVTHIDESKTKIDVPWPLKKKRNLKEAQMDLFALYRSSLKPHANRNSAILFLALLLIFFNVLADFEWCKPIREVALMILRTERMLWVLLVLTVFIHLFEALLAFFLARRRLRLDLYYSLGWTGITFCVGAASLRPLARFAGLHQLQQSGSAPKPAQEKKKINTATPTSNSKNKKKKQK